MPRLLITICLLITLSACGSLIYKIRGPKYEGKFVANSYPSELDSTSYYEREYANNSNESIYGYLKFKGNGIFFGYTSFGKRLTPDELDLIHPNSNYFIVKNGSLRWEIYHDSYNGYNLFKGEVHSDTIDVWQFGSKGNSKKTYVRVN